MYLDLDFNLYIYNMIYDLFIYDCIIRYNRGDQ